MLDGWTIWFKKDGGSMLKMDGCFGLVLMDVLLVKMDGYPGLR